MNIITNNHEYHYAISAVHRKLATFSIPNTLWSHGGRYTDILNPGRVERHSVTFLFMRLFLFHYLSKSESKLLKTQNKGWTLATFPLTWLGSSM